MYSTDIIELQQNLPQITQLKAGNNYKKQL